MRIKVRKSQFVSMALLTVASVAFAEPVTSTLTGNSLNRVDVAFVGDGYQSTELNTYHDHVESAIDYMFRGTEEPFNRYQNYFNFHRIDVVSNESGADIAPPASRGTISGIMDRNANSAPNVIEFYTNTVLPPNTTFKLDQYIPGSDTPVTKTLTLPDGLLGGSFAYIFSDTTTTAEFDAWFGANSSGNATIFSGTYGDGGLNSTYVLKDVGGTAIDAFGNVSVENAADDWVYRKSLTRESPEYNPAAFTAIGDAAFGTATNNVEAGENAFPMGSFVAEDAIFVDTALDSRFYFDGRTERLLNVDVNKALAVESRSLDFEAEMRFAVVNTEKFGGAGGAYATFAGGNPAAAEIGLHEIAHSFGGLADEYVSFAAEFPNNEPSEANVTTDPSGAKWEQWLGYEQEGIGEIGVYEGARYYQTGIYRPSDDSKMKSLFRPFDAVSREQLVLDIYKFVDPIDDYGPKRAGSSDSDVLGFTGNAWIDVVDPNTIDRLWLINDERIEFDGEELPISEFVALGIAPGVHDLTVIATDNTDWIRLESQRPSQEITWTVRYFPGDFNDNELADVTDIDALTAAALDPDNDLSMFDLTLDGLVDGEDRQLWIDANQVLLGDSNLNGTVQFADFLVLSTNFGSDETSWGNGNFDGVPGVSFADFLMLSANFGKSSSAAQSVPEPASHVAMLIIAAALLQLRKRRR